MSDVSIDRLSAQQGAPVYDSAGEKIGEIEEIYYDTETRRPEWIGIGTGFFGTKRVLVPVEGAVLTDDGLSVHYEKDYVKDSPDIDAEEISEETERELYVYYRLEGGGGREQARETARDEASVVRSEEELRVGKRETEAGRARLRKWVETEPVEKEVELERETARVARERIDQPVGETEFGEEEIDVPLRREEPVVEKRAVAKERIGIEKDVDTERETVTGEVRKERVDVDDDAGR